MKKEKNNKIYGILLVAFVFVIAVVLSPKIIMSSMDIGVSFKNTDSSSLILIAFDVVIIISLAIILFLLIEQFQSTSDMMKKEKRREKRIKEKLKKIPNFNETELVKEIFYVYREIERNRCNYNGEILKKYVTDELFEEFKKEHELLEQNKHKRYITDIKMKDIKILKIKENMKNYEILVRTTICNKDYIKDENGVFVLGNDLDLEYPYDIKLIRNKKVSEINMCPECFHLLENNTANKCPHCGETLLQDTSHIKMSEKKLVIEE